jgi:hypothetical protein
MKINELPNWPPQWQPLLLRSPKFFTGEIGVLKSVRALLGNDDYLDLTIEHEGIRYNGLFRIDVALRNRIVALLQQQTDRPIKEIGELDIEFER